MLMFGNAVIIFILILLNSSVKTISLLFKMETHNINHIGVVFLLSILERMSFLIKKKSQGVLTTHKLCNQFGQ